MPHTPGPWIDWEPAPDATTQIMQKGSGIRIADVWCTDLPECSGNAALIAAAPDLLAAAEELLTYADASVGILSTGLARKSLEQLRAATRRARRDE